MGEERGEEYLETQLQDRGERSESTISWNISKHLLDAHSRSGQALERYLLLQHLERNATADETLQLAIEQTIEDHERIIEDLEAALAALDRAEDRTD